MCSAEGYEKVLEPIVGPKNENQTEAVRNRIDHERVSYKPKVRIQRHSSLFIIDYSDIPPPKGKNIKRQLSTQTPSKISNFKVYIYIDIPTIDYYTDELTDNRLSRFNKKFKLHLLREFIYKSFTNGDDHFWQELMSLNDKVMTCTLSVSSSGSLRYVETVKYLIEMCYETLVEFIDAGKLVLKFKLEVSPTSHKWFTTFLNKRLLRENAIEFLETGSYLEFSENSSTPFKEYYAQLNSKFTSKYDAINDTLESIVIITNLTGVKALLTILSDRPLTSYILQDSIDALHDNGLTKKPLAESHTDASEDETPLKRESSSLLSFQNSLLTSNKDKSVKVRSLSLSRKLHKSQGFTSDELMIHKTTSRDLSSNSIGSAGSNSNIRNTSILRGDYQDRAETPYVGKELYVKGGGDAGDGDHENEEEEDDEDDEEEEEDEEANGSDDGISFSVPSKLSRSGSSADISDAQRPAARRGRFRSLSLMDPVLHGPFKQRESSVSLYPTEDEVCSIDGKKVTNIYVHDGEFDETSSTKRGKKKINKSVLSRQNSANGLIPPEFYSRISSPSTSASSSNSSLDNLNMAPGTFSKWLGPDDSSKNAANTTEANTLFEKKLVDKSFEEHRKQNSINLFSALMGGLRLNSDRNPLALNFKSNKVIPPEMQILDEEDLLMSGFHNGNGNFTAEETSEDERRSTSTVVGEEPGLATLDSASCNNLNRKSTLELQTSNSNLKMTGVNLNLQLYDTNVDDHTNKENLQSQNGSRTPSPDKPKPKYKKAIQLDLYGDDDLHNMGGWILGGNAR